MAFNRDDTVFEIINELIECIDICIENKNLWLTDKTKMIIFLSEAKPDFYAKRGRLIHSIVMYNDIKTMSVMLKKLYLAQIGQVNFQDISNEMVMSINSSFAPDATKEVLDTIKNNMQK